MFPAFFLDIRFYDGMYMCLPYFNYKPVYGILLFLLIFILPTCLIMFSFIKIYKIAYKQNRSITDKNSTNGERISKKDVKIIKTLLTMTVGFYIMWGPTFTFNMLWDVIYGNTLDKTLEFILAYFSMNND